MQQFCRLLRGDEVIPLWIKDEKYFSLSHLVPDLNPESFSILMSGQLCKGEEILILESDRWLPPINGIRQILATGFNYPRHQKELSTPCPKEPELFCKSIGALSGPYDPIVYPPYEGVKLDWETELAVVIGKEALDLEVEDAMGVVLGYLCLNDISDRSRQYDQEGKIHLMRAKSRPGFAPIGPILATGLDPMHLRIWTQVNGHLEQEGNTAEMHFSIARLISFFSQHLKLCPGDLLTTGTPCGVGYGKNKFLKRGDILECGIDHLGVQKHIIV